MTDSYGNRLDDCGVCTLLPTVTGTVRAEQATCPVHGTPPYAPVRAPLASSQALPADQGTKPSDEEVRDAARKVNGIRPGLRTDQAYAAIQALVLLGWRPVAPPTEFGHDDIEQLAELKRRLAEGSARRD